MLAGKISVEKDRRYTIAETCDILHISRKTLRKYTKAGAIQLTLHTPSGQISYKGSEIERFYRTTI